MSPAGSLRSDSAFSPGCCWFLGQSCHSEVPNQVQADLISCSKSDREEQAGGCCVLLLVCGVTCLLEEKEGGSESFLKKALPGRAHCSSP